jgi:hypothetical protein
MRNELYSLERPSLTIRKIFRFKSGEKTQHPGHGGFMVDVLDFGPKRRRIGYHVIFQKDRQIYYL